ASLNAIQERPWLGYGPATFRQVFAWYMPPELAPFGGAAALGGRMHNVYLEVVLESGLIGLVAYGALLMAIVTPLLRFDSPRIVRKAQCNDRPHPPAPSPFEMDVVDELVSQVSVGATLQSRPGRVCKLSPTKIRFANSIAMESEATRGMRPDANIILRAAILAALVANLVNNLFSFESTTTTLLFWTLAGMAHAETHPSPPDSAPRYPRLGWIVAVVGIGLAGWLVVPDMLAQRGEQLARDERWSEAVDWFETAIDVAPTPEMFSDALGTTYATWATQTRDPAIWSRGAAVYAALIADRDQVVAYYTQRGVYLRRWYAMQRDPLIAEQALTTYTAAIRLSPRDPDLWLDRGLVWLDMDNFAGALSDFDEANRLRDNYARYYGAMSLYALEMGDQAAAAAWNERAIQAQQAWNDWVWRR
ncbi:MAG: O-antigen ligase family protein, partial [Anaerolineae bacterium]|nr:O-antigen ligase family protein [Anaerolineae bacterium]